MVGGDGRPGLDDAAGGGAFGCCTRKQVELFCVDHLIMDCTKEKLVKAISAAASMPVKPNKDMHISCILVNNDDMDVTVAAFPPECTTWCFL